MNGVKIQANATNKQIELARQQVQRPVSRLESGPMPAVAPQVAYHRAQAQCSGLKSADLLALQRNVGNRMVQMMMAQRADIACDRQLGMVDEGNHGLAMQSKVTVRANEPKLRGRFQEVQYSSAPTIQPIKSLTSSALIQSKAPTLNPKASLVEWKGAPEQEKFMDEVLKAAKAARRKRHTPYRSLEESELSVVRGTSGVKMKPEAAAQASQFLAAAQAALVTQRNAVEATKRTKGAVHVSDIEKDILDTLDVKISGYRSVETEERIWRGYFRNKRGYYNRTIKNRSRYADPHGPDAVSFMVGWIGGKKAPPGYSKHTLGVSIDFAQKRRVTVKGKQAIKWLDNSTIEGNEPGQIKWWCDTWLYSWLESNAKRFHFKKLKTEPWHYDYVGPDELRVENGPTLPAGKGNVPHPSPY